MVGKIYVRNVGTHYDEFGRQLPAGTIREVLPVSIESEHNRMEKINSINDVIGSCRNDPRIKSLAVTQEKETYPDGRKREKFRVYCSYQ